MSTGLVTIIIPTYNRIDSLRRTIESLSHQRYRNHEIIVVDDASTECTFEDVAAPDRVRVIRLDERRGPSYARNVGILAARGGYVWFLDSDVLIPDPGTLERLVTAIESRPGIGALGGEIVAHEPPLDRAYGRKICWNGKNRRIVAREHDREWRACDYLATCNCFVRREELLRLQGFDESFVFGAEDMDLGYRLQQAGLQNLVSHSFAVLHCHEKTGRYDDETIRYQKTRMQFAKKHFSTGRLYLLYLYELGGAALFYLLLAPKLVFKLVRGKRISQQNVLGGWCRLRMIFLDSDRGAVSMIPCRTDGGRPA